MKTNISEIIGFIFVANELTYKKESHKEFIDTCNILCRNKRRKFIYALRNSKGLSDVLKKANYDNLNMTYLPDFEILTDTVINKQLFGSVLLDIHEPYLLHEEEKKGVVMQNPKLQFQPLFSEYILNCLSPIDKLNTLEDTKINDSVYQEYLKDEVDLAFIRECMINKLFGIDYDKDKLRDIVDRREEAQQYCMYRALTVGL